MRELHGFKAHHRVVLGCGERLGGGGSTEQGRSAAEENGGGVAPVRFGRGEAVWELREGEARLMVGAIGVERVCGGGSAAEVSSPGFGGWRRVF